LPRYAAITSIFLLCAGQARLLAGALRERTKFQTRVKRDILELVRSSSNSSLRPDSGQGKPTTKGQLARAP
jgi:hypothetical protein